MIEEERMMRKGNRFLKRYEVYKEEKSTFEAFERTMSIVDGLIGMDEDTYLKCKLMILSSMESKSKGLFNLFKDVFAITDKRRPLLIGMKGGAA